MTALSLPRPATRTTVRAGSWWALGAVLLLVFPFLASESLIRTGILSGIAIIGAVGLNLLTGLAKQFSVAHAAFMAIGAYALAYAIIDLGLPFELAVIGSVLVSAGIGALASPLAIKMRHLGLALVTFGLVFLVQHILRNVDVLAGGSSPKIVPNVSLFGYRMDLETRFGALTVSSSAQFYLMITIVAAAVCVFTTFATRSRVGRAMAMMGSGATELSAEHSGVPINRVKVIAFVYSAALAGLAGALYASYTRVLQQEHFGIHLSVEYLAMIVIGGLGTVSGSILGALFVVAMPHLIELTAPVLPFVAEQGSSQGLTIAQFTTLLYGVLIVVVLSVEPAGIVGVGRRLRRRLMPPSAPPSIEKD